MVSPRQKCEINILTKHSYHDESNHRELWSQPNNLTHVRIMRYKIISTKSSLLGTDHTKDHMIF